MWLLSLVALLSLSLIAYGTHSLMQDRGPVRRVVIVPKEINVADVVEGGQFLFEVQGFNKGGKRVPVSDATVGVDNPAIGADTVNADGTNGVLTAGTAPAAGNITARAAGIDATPFPINVVADNTVATVQIVPTV